jgi:hypothetical protein
MQKAALYTSGIVFTVVATSHLARLAMGIEIVVGGVVLPMWVSFLGALFTGLLAVWVVVAARRS